MTLRRMLFIAAALSVAALAGSDLARSGLVRDPTAWARGEAAARALLVLVGAFAIVFAAARRPSRQSVDPQVDRFAAEARTDRLTGLGNLRAFDEALGEAIAARSAAGTPFVLLAIDVDGLKEINDTRGHPAGDERIKQVARCLQITVGSAGSVHRTGGDEFMAILPACRNWHGLELAQRIEESTRKAVGGRAVSIGLTESLGTEGRHLLVGQADLALYEAKRTRLNAVVFNPGLATGNTVAERPDIRPSGDQRALAAALARAVDAKDGGTQSHSERVAQLCVGIAQRLNFTGDHLERLRVAGLLHDAGKIGVADAVLQKPGPLTTRERRAMDEHVQIGHGILMAAGFPAEAEWVLHHHEHYDGSGYPEGKRAGEIPIEARIIAVADAYEAMTSDRPYRSRISVNDALDELRLHAGSQFDGRCVNALVEVVIETERDEAIDLRRPAEISRLRGQEALLVPRST